MAFVISIFLFILVAQFKVLATLKLATFLASEYLVLKISPGASNLTRWKRNQEEKFLWKFRVEQHFGCDH